MLIPGENAMVFIPNGYGYTVLVGHVAQELPHGWILDPCRDVVDTQHGDCWSDLARGKDKSLRRDCKFGPLIDGGLRVPFGCISIVWHGELPK